MSAQFTPTSRFVAARSRIVLSLALLVTFTVVSCSKADESPTLETVEVETVALAPSSGVSQRPAATVAEPRRQPTLQMTATALAVQIQSTPPPPAPKTGGAYPPPATGGGGAPSLNTSYSIAGHGTVNINPAAYGNGGAPQIVASGLPAGLPRGGRASLRSPQSGEGYASITDNPFRSVEDHPLSTFAIDVDTASYANVRRFVENGALPPPDAVRIEELINYFAYDDPPPVGDEPFGVTVDAAEAPWTPGHSLLRIGIKGQSLELEGRPTSNLVFLLDVSGSMGAANKLPLVKKAMTLLVENLGENDRVSIVVYAGASGMVLPPTSAYDRAAILDAIERLNSGGSTAGAEGIVRAYELAESEFLEDGNNRVILATDGDFNVGVTSNEELEELITDQAKKGIFLTVLGFGMGNLQDEKLETLADRGNGNYAYIDTLLEARKVLVEEIGGTLHTIAKDVKLQIEFNPARVAGYRLIGYENRLLAARDFNDDTKDAGEIGAGHSLTALYEVVPVGVPFEVETLNEPPVDVESAGDDVAEEDGETVGDADVDPLRYDPQTGEAAGSEEMLTVKLRYKQPDGDTSTRFDVSYSDIPLPIEAASSDMKFCAAVAAYGMLLRRSPHGGHATYEGVIELAEAGLGADERGYRAAFVELVRSTIDASHRVEATEAYP